ncbi:MAG: hypothetical protein Q4C53_04910 [Clostridia bacterium]|nr:hypothetical protein [Clostridia bacterium]
MMKLKAFVSFLTVLCLSASALAAPAVFTAKPYDVIGEDGEPIYEQGYELVLDEDKGTAVFSDITNQNDPVSMMSVYRGNFTRSGDIVTVTVPVDENGSEYRWIVTLDGEIIVSATTEYIDASVAKIAGTYTVNDPNLGTTNVTIHANGATEAESETSGPLMGSIALLADGNWDLMLFDANYDFAADWSVTFTPEGTMLHEPLAAFVASKIAGTYRIFGDLGEIEVVVDAEGAANAFIPLDGTKVHMSGYASPSEDGTIGSVYLANEFGYGFSVEIRDLGDGTLNYTGTVTTPLAAG